jgi:hypothetical protein
MELFNYLPGSGSVTTVHYAAIAEAVFSMSSAPSDNRNVVVYDQLLSYATPRQTDFRAGTMASLSNSTSYHVIFFRCCPCGHGVKEKQMYVHGSQRGLMPGVTVLAGCRQLATYLLCCFS